MLKDLLPRSRRIAAIINPEDANAAKQLGNARLTGVAVNVELAPIVPVREVSDLDAAFTAIVAAGVDGALRMSIRSHS